MAITSNMPKDGSNEPIQWVPLAKAAIDETYDASVSSSTEITLNAATRMIEVTAIDKAIFMKWGTADAASTDWDHVIPANSTRSFVVPVETMADGALYTAVNFIEEAASAHLCVSEFA